MPQRITVSGTDAGTLAMTASSVPGISPSVPIEHSADLAVDVLGVDDCGLVDDETVATFGNITAALGHSLPITVCSHFCDEEPASFFSSRQAGKHGRRDVQLLIDSPKCKECT